MFIKINDSEIINTDKITYLQIEEQEYGTNRIKKYFVRYYLGRDFDFSSPWFNSEEECESWLKEFLRYVNMEKSIC